VRVDAHWTREDEVEAKPLRAADDDALARPIELARRFLDNVETVVHGKRDRIELVLAALMFTRYAKSGRRFSDVSDNAFYWDFVVGSWVLLYLLICWFPRVWPS